MLCSYIHTERKNRNRFFSTAPIPFFFIRFFLLSFSFFHHYYYFYRNFIFFSFVTIQRNLLKCWSETGQKQICTYYHFTGILYSLHLTISPMHILKVCIINTLRMKIYNKINTANKHSKIEKKELNSRPAIATTEAASGNLMELY